ncbi:MAG: chemotaxis protein CheX [Planctomycetota bacterium]|jgi:chemotaxis protein CheX|nr:chemotaxis protein CheX [Planctomycetota bacterium]
MRVITVAENNTTPNMIRGVFQLKHVPNVDFVHISGKEDLLANLDESSILLIDWESDPPPLVELIHAAKGKNPNTPILLLCPKMKAGTALAGIKAGAASIVNKPLDPDDLIRSIRLAVQKGQATRPTVNVEFINPFIDAAKNVFSQMCQVEIKRKKIFLKDDYKMMGDVSGAMSLAGIASGSVVVSLPRELACMVVGNMLGEAPATDLTQDVKDAVGEIINMIAGQAKAALVKTRYHFTISIPNVITDPGQEIFHQKGAPNIVVLFEGAGFDFVLQVCLAPNDSPTAETLEKPVAPTA